MLGPLGPAQTPPSYTNLKTRPPGMSRIGNRCSRIGIGVGIGVGVTVGVDICRCWCRVDEHNRSFMSRIGTRFSRIGLMNIIGSS